MPRLGRTLLVRVRMAVGLALLLSGAAFVGAAAAQGGGARDPLKLFEPMYPVFSDDRCSNCHGNVNVVTGDGHPGGPVKGVQIDKDGDMCCDSRINLVCAGCHDEGHVTDEDGVERSPWRLAPKAMSFVGKDTKA